MNKEQLKHKIAKEISAAMLKSGLGAKDIVLGKQTPEAIAQILTNNNQFDWCGFDPYTVIVAVLRRGM